MAEIVYTAMLDVQIDARLFPSGESDGQAASRQRNSEPKTRGLSVSRGRSKTCDPVSVADQYAKDCASGNQLICVNGSYQNSALATFRSDPPSAGMIASELGITEATVKSHVSTMLARPNVSDRTQGVVTALQRGLVHL